MKTTLVTNPGFQPFTFSVTVETEREAEMLRSLFVESAALATALRDETACEWNEANELFEELGNQAQHVLSR
jgi:hypothetical protein